MKIVICGAGNIGSSILKEFYQDYEITLIDQDHQKLSQLSNKYDVMAVKGSACCINTLEKADIKNADFVFAALPFEHENLFISKISKSCFGIKRSIAKIKDIWFCDYRSKVLKEFCVDHLVFPAINVAEKIYSAIFATKYNQVCSIFKDHNLLLVSLPLPISFFKIKEFFDSISAVVFAVVRGGASLDLLDLSQLNSGDQILIAAHKKDLHEINKKLGKINDYELIIILGGGDASFYLAQKISIMHPSVDLKIVEAKSAKAKHIAEQITGAEVINSSIINCESFWDSDLKDKKSIAISATNQDQTNIVSQLMLKDFGLSFGICLLQQESYVKLAKSLSIDQIILPGLITASTFKDLIKVHSKKKQRAKVHSFCNEFFTFVEFEILNEKDLEIIRSFPIEYIKKIIICNKKDKLTEISPEKDFDLKINDHLVIYLESAYKKEATNFLNF